MSSKDVAVSVRGLSKSYTIAHNAEKHTTAAEALMHRLKNPFQKVEKETFWALRDVEFDIQKGDVVGIIGRNGAGKSTLLKILSRITEPTTGQIDLYGRVGSLLEVGTGFHPELTGRENVFLNGAILGMSKREIARQFDAIVDFSGTEQFLDTPVKRYSSGMYVRLAFAVAAHLNPEILIVDEVLAVGDAAFQKKCLGKMQDISREGGKTVLFVSHNMAAVRQLCSAAILLEGGRIVLQGSASEAVVEYLSGRSNALLHKQINEHGVELCDVFFQDLNTGESTDSPVFNHDYELVVRLIAHRPITEAGLIVRIVDDVETRISSLCTPEEGIERIDFSGSMEVRFFLPKLKLFPGRYAVTVNLYRFMDPITYLDAPNTLNFDVQPAVVRNGVSAYQHAHGIVRVSDGVTYSSFENGKELLDRSDAYLAVNE